MKKYLETNDNENMMTQNLWNAAKAVLRGKFIAIQSYLKKQGEGFPGGTVVESPPAEAGDTGSCPGPGRSYMPRSGWAHEPWPLSLRVRSLCSATGEATTVRGPRTKKTKI